MENEFCILHVIEEKQLLIDTEYDHDKEEHKIAFKFWSEDANGFATIKLGIADTDKFEAMFTKLKDPEYARGIIDNIINRLIG